MKLKEKKPQGAPRLWESAVGPIIVVPALIGGGLLAIAAVKWLLIWLGFFQ